MQGTGSMIPPPRHVFARSSPWTVAAITVLALILRLYRIEAQSLWVDEVVTWHAAQVPIADLLQVRNYYAMAHSLYFALMHMVLLVSDSEFALRLPSALFGAFSIPLLYLVGERWLSRGTGLVAAVLLAVSPLHLYYSQEARPYAVVVFFILFAMVCLEAMVREPGRTRWRVGFVASSAAALLSHPVALAFVPASVLYAALIASRASLRRLRGTFAALLVIIVGLQTVVLPRVHANHPAEPFGLAIAYTGWTFATGFSLGPSIRELHAPDPVQVALAHAPVVALGLLVFGGLAVSGVVRVWSERRRIAAVVAAWLLLPVLFVVFGSLATHHPFNVRYVLPAFPAFLLLVGFGVLTLPKGLWRGGAWALVLGLSAASILNYHADPRYQREDYRSAVGALRDLARPGDVVVVSAPYTAIMLDYYNPGPVAVVPFYEPPVMGHPDPVGRPPNDWRSELERFVADRESFWVLLSRTFHPPVEEELVRFLDERFERVRDRSWAGTRLVLYSLPDGRAAR